ncbi:MAG: flagellar basal body-associated FliL family protein [Gammaproteobacteria bacterium]|nr:flagellar basal body-associated FliL family protein [Gammaproteobacteria bacterium]
MILRALYPALAFLFLAAALGAPAFAEDEDTPAEDIGYYALKPSIVSNLTGGPKYIRCDVQLMTKHASEIPKIELHSPALRHAMLLLVAGQDGNKLLTRDGKEGLRKAALAAVQAQLEELTGDPIVNDLFFTAYYVK